MRLPWRRCSQARLRFHAGPGQRVENDDVVAIRGEPVREVGADEAGPAGDENRTRKQRGIDWLAAAAGLRSCHKSPLLEFLPRLVDPVVRGLARHPFGEFGQPLAEVPRRT